MPTMKRVRAERHAVRPALSSAVSGVQMEENHDARCGPVAAADRVALLEQRIVLLERRLEGADVRWRSRRSILRVLVISPLALFAVIALLRVSSAYAQLPFPVLLLGLWIAAVAFWAAVEVFVFKRVRFTLSTLLMVILIVGIAFASWRALVLEPFLQEQAALAALQGVKKKPWIEPVGPAWIRDILGDRYFQRVTQFEIVGQDGCDEELVHLKAFPKLRCLFLTGPNYTDAGLGHLQLLKQPIQIYFTRTSATDGGLDALRKAAPNLEIDKQ